MQFQQTMFLNTVEYNLVSIIYHGNSHFWAEGKDIKVRGERKEGFFFFFFCKLFFGFSINFLKKWTGWFSHDGLQPQEDKGRIMPIDGPFKSPINEVSFLIFSKKK